MKPRDIAILAAVAAGVYLLLSKYGARVDSVAQRITTPSDLAGTGYI